MSEWRPKVRSKLLPSAHSPPATMDHQRAGDLAEVMKIAVVVTPA
jgi:hypothetical protein